MLNETANLMSEHILKGREAEYVIDDLEVLFKVRYDDFCLQREPDDSDSQKGFENGSRYDSENETK